MKKFISLLISAAMLTGTCSAMAVSAADKKTDTDKDIVIFGDSIAAGYTVDNSLKYNYGEICGDYLGGNVDNFAVSGATTSDMLNVISSLNADQVQAVKNAEYVFISIGGNDLMHYASKYFLDYAAKKKLLVDGKSAADVPSDPGISTLINLIDMDKVQAYCDNKLNAMDLVGELKKVSNGLRVQNEEKNYPGIIPVNVIPNIESAVSKIRTINPNAKIMVQTIYQPVQLDPEYITATYGADSSYVDFIGQIRSNFKDVLDTYRTKLNDVKNIEVVDVYNAFTSVPEGVAQNNANPGHAYYFTNIQLPGNKKDFHPNQNGHIVIAAAYLNKIGKLHDDSGLLSTLFKEIKDTSGFPLIALDVYKNAAGNLITGDVNFDEKVDARDASLVLKNYAVISGSEPSMLSNLQNKTADVNSDDSSDAKDATAILRYYAYLANNGTSTIEEFLK